MSGLPSASAIDPAEYAAIESTIGATERGRWFLAEHARRARADEMQTILGAIERLERTMAADRATEAVGSLRGDLADMAEAIRRTKAEITALSVPGADQTRLASASQALDAIVRATEQATSDILGAAEEVQEAAWVLRERHIEPEVCEALDRHATAIYTACSFQDLTAQRTARIIYTLRYLEDRIAAMIAIWGEEEAGRIPPPPEDEVRRPTDDELCQVDVDRYIAMNVPAITAAAIHAPPGSPALHEDIVFVPVSGSTARPFETPAPMADREIAAEAAAEQEIAGQEMAVEATAGPEMAELEAFIGSAGLPEDEPLFDFVVTEEDEELSLDAIDALPAEKRLALFA
jgi:chemotaxis regulatin CheY-phosphate phosphatase CheZ